MVKLKMLYFTGLSNLLEHPGTYSQLPDAVLVTGYKETGDQQYLADLYKRYSGMLFGVCLKYLKSPELARDACTDIYEELVSKVLRHEIDNFKGWLHMLAKNHCLQKLRAAKKITFSGLEPDFMQYREDTHLEEIMQKEAYLESMGHCIERLNEEQKQMVELFYLQEKCYNEITEITGLPWNTVRSHIQNGRRNLKICMEQHSSE